MATVTSTADSAAAAREAASSYRRSILLQRILIYTLLIFISLLIMLPLLWMLSTSLKPKSQIFTQGIEWIPRTITLDNYANIFNNSQTPIARWFFNSTMISTVTTVLILAIDSLAAYAYARMDFPGRKVLYALLLATLFLPGIMFLVPNFLTVYGLGWLNSYQGVIVPALAGVFGVFYLHQFFAGIPKELEEAAEIDGANKFQTFIQIVLPLAKPALATLGVITFLATWNEFLWALLVLKDRSLQTLPPGLRTLQGAFTTEYGLMMAGAVIVAVPVLIIYIALQRFIVASVASSGLKG